MHTGNAPGFRALGAILGILAAVSPFAIDMYLPAMPQMAEGLGVSEAAFQVTLIAYFLSFGLAQLAYGPWADAAGRRLPLFTGLSIFVIASFGAASASSLESLAAWRFLQGLGGAVTMVIPRAVVRDRYTGIEATRLMAMVMLVIATSPMLAPLFGSAVDALAGWRAIFVALGLLGLLGLALVLFALPETLPPEARRPARPAVLWAGAKRLLADPVYMGLTLVGGFGIGSFFVFVSSAAFVYTGTFGLSPTEFSIAFAINAIGFFAASQLAANAAARLGMMRLCVIGVSGFFAFTALLLALTLAGQMSLLVIATCLFIANAFLGLVIPTAGVLALEQNGDIAGLASSLGGTLQMLAGSAVIAVLGPFFDGTPLPMIAGIAACGALSFVLAMSFLRPRRAMA
ncbi:multidrug effflux MFS transporter [Pseudoruegeria sp. SHC-113]|uniref:multidrug effflux MFS transporter n=1 Tax=Pseudoruegeria sp. SHC-113 TaxID=2855439 RepID=UPI0021BB31C5|nr:multidrug effflux MFS transporter [Pseudoruegeria sp. SHC-113]MCT8160214.1 multidrug effflux MFS transporter [Pseudoruegeria sp. SHC-113]